MSPVCNTPRATIRSPPRPAHSRANRRRRRAARSATFVACGFQYVAKLNPGLTQVLYATYVSGEYGATPAGISVDAQGDVFVAGTTVSPDYPTTPNAYEPQYIASAAPG